MDDEGDILTAAHVAEAVIEWGKLLQAARIAFSTDVGVVQTPIVTDTYQSLGWEFVPIKKFMVSDENDLAVTRPIENLARQVIGGYVGSRNHLTAEALQPRPLPLDTQGVDSGQEVFAVGYPNGSAVPVTVTGIVAAPLATSSDAFMAAHGLGSLQVIQLDIRIDHGNSGGPVFRQSDGKVIGLVHSIGVD